MIHDFNKGVNLLIILISLAVIALAVAGYFILVQRRIVELKQMCENSLHQIYAQTESRYDLLGQINRKLKEYTAYEGGALEAIISRRGGNITPEELNLRHEDLRSAFGVVNALAESYPELKASGLYSSFFDKADHYENLVRKSRMIFNDTVTRYNIYVQQFPNNLAASRLGAKEMDKLYFRGSEGKHEYPED